MAAQENPVWVVIPAAGLGHRIGSELPKQYLKIHDKTLIEHTLNCFQFNDEIAGIVVVLSPDDEYWKQLEISTKSKPIYTVNGGSERSDSVLQGLNYLRNQINLDESIWVMVHDAARPCLTNSDIQSLLSIRKEDAVGGILASPVRDTMKRTMSDQDSKSRVEISHSESRENLWHALTPQMFRLGELIKAIKFCQKNNETITDECSAMEKMGMNPVIVEGSHNNLKVTYPSDINLVSFLLSHKEE